MVRHNDAVYVNDISQAVEKILTRLQGVDFDAFEADGVLQDATIRQLEIVGEAASRVTETFKTEHARVDWRGMKDLRNVLIHGYATVNLRQLWGVAQRDIPLLREQLALVTSKESRSLGEEREPE